MRVTNRELKLMWYFKKCGNDAEYRRCEGYIQSIDDPVTREVFTLRYVRHMSWRSVAMALGGGNTEDSVRKIAERRLAQ